MPRYQPHIGIGVRQRVLVDVRDIGWIPPITKIWCIRPRGNGDSGVSPARCGQSRTRRKRSPRPQNITTSRADPEPVTWVVLEALETHV